MKTSASFEFWAARFALVLFCCFLSSVLVAVCAESTISTSAVQEIQLQVSKSGKAGFTLLSPSETGVAFTNNLSDQASAENRVLNNGSGVAAGDFDNDGRVDLFFC